MADVNGTLGVEDAGAEGIKDCSDGEDLPDIVAVHLQAQFEWRACVRECWILVGVWKKSHEQRAVPRSIALGVFVELEAR